MSLTFLKRRSRRKLKSACALLSVLIANGMSSSLNAYSAVSNIPRNNPAGMTELPKMKPILPSVEGVRQPLTGEMQKYERTVLRSEPIKLGALIQVATMKPLLLDADRNQPISLQEALAIGVNNNLSLKISQKSEFYQKMVFFNYLANWMPTLSSTFSLTNSNINSGETNTHSNVWTNRLIFPLFTGGNYSQFIVAQKYRTKGWHKATEVSRNDALLDAYKKYTDLALQYQLLRIRIKAVELSRTLLKQQQVQLQEGTSTRYNLMTAQSNLKSSEQQLQDQQVTTRKAAMALSYSLDLPLSINLVPTEIEMPIAPLIRGYPKINQLLYVAYHNNPELREYEYFRLAAARDIQIGMASYYPTVAAFLAYTRSSLTYSGSSDGLAGAAVSSISSSSGSSSGSTSNTALGQTASLSPGSDTDATSGANTSSSTVVAASGGTPMANVQSGTLVTSGSVAPSIISPLSLSSSSSSNINGSNTASSGTSPGTYNTFQAGISLSWSLGNSGLGTAANIVALKGLSRQALLQANQKLQNVEQAVRTDYTSCLSSLAHIESTASALDTNEEELRLSQVSMGAGTTTVNEFERAKSNYISGLSTEAESIVSLKQAEAQLQHDIGVITVDSLTNGITIDDLMRTGGKR